MIGTQMTASRITTKKTIQHNRCAHTTTCISTAKFKQQTASKRVLQTYRSRFALMAHCQFDIALTLGGVNSCLFDVLFDAVQRVDLQIDLQLHMQSRTTHNE
jgi:hypothetical protein